MTVKLVLPCRKFLPSQNSSEKSRSLNIPKKDFIKYFSLANLGTCKRMGKGYEMGLYRRILRIMPAATRSYTTCETETRMKMATRGGEPLTVR